MISGLGETMKWARDTVNQHRWGAVFVWRAPGGGYDAGHVCAWRKLGRLHVVYAVACGAERWPLQAWERTALHPNIADCAD